MIEQQEHLASRPAAVTIRRGGADDDLAVARIDGSFSTDTVYEVHGTESGFTLREVGVSPPVVKRFPDDPEGEDTDEESVRFVGVGEQGDVVGFIDLTYQEWNQRMVIADLAIAPEHRGQGLGRRLMDAAVEHGREREARTLWLEVSNINAPAVRAYRRFGFTFCGLDVSHYRGTASEGEIALFMSRDLDGH